MVINTIQHVEPHIIEDGSLPASTKRFINESPFIRLTILGLVQYARKQLDVGMSILDVGAGDSPYKLLFSHVHYKSTDFAVTKYHAFSGIDYICPANDIPVQDSSFDAVLCTEVLEHVPEPDLVLKEFHRVLKSGGHIFVTTPFMHPLHEEPYDFYRYTPYSLKKLVESAGFEIIFITPRGGWIVSIASTLRRYILKPTLNLKVLSLYTLIFLPIFVLPKLIVHLLPLRFLAWLDKQLDTQQTWTLGYALHARKREG